MAGGTIISATPAGSRGGAAAPYGGLGGGPYLPPRLIAAPEVPLQPGGTYVNPLGGGGNDPGGPPGGGPPGVGAAGGFVYPAPPLNSEDKRPRPPFGVGPSQEPWKPDIYMPGKPIGKQQIVNPSRPNPPRPQQPNQMKPTATPTLGSPPTPQAPGLVPMTKPMRPQTPGPRPTPRPMGPQFTPAGPPRPPTVNPYPTKPTYQTTPNYGPGFNLNPGNGVPQAFVGGNRPGMYQPPPMMLVPPPPPGAPMPPPGGGGGWNGPGGGGDLPPPGGPGGPGGPDGGGPGGPGGPGDDGGGDGNTGGPPTAGRFGALPGMRPQSTQYSPQQQQLLDQIRQAILRSGTAGAYGQLTDADIGGSLNFGMGLTPGRRPMASPIG